LAGFRFKQQEAVLEMWVADQFTLAVRRWCGQSKDAAKPRQACGCSPMGETPF
jgi:hypothetical protein